MKAAVYSFLSKPGFGLLFLVLAISIVLASCKPDRKSTRDSAVKQPSSSAPVFTAEGELFILGFSDDTISHLSIEIADNEFEQERGLMYRHYLPEESGMLFIFPDERYRSFWMKNTHIPLDIMYIDKDLVIRTIRKNTVPYSEASVPSNEPAQYVLEVNAGYTDVHGVEEGMRLQFRRFNENGPDK